MATKDHRESESAEADANDSVVVPGDGSQKTIIGRQDNSDVLLLFVREDAAAAAKAAAVGEATVVDEAEGTKDQHPPDPDTGSPKRGGRRSKRLSGHTAGSPAQKSPRRGGTGFTASRDEDDSGADVPVVTNVTGGSDTLGSPGGAEVEYSPKYNLRETRRKSSRLKLMEAEQLNASKDSEEEGDGDSDDEGLSGSKSDMISRKTVLPSTLPPPAKKRKYRFGRGIPDAPPPGQPGSQFVLADASTLKDIPGASKLPPGAKIIIPQEPIKLNFSMLSQMIQSGGSNAAQKKTIQSYTRASMSAKPLFPRKTVPIYSPKKQQGSFLDNEDDDSEDDAFDGAMEDIDQPSPMPEATERNTAISVSALSFPLGPDPALEAEEGGTTSPAPVPPPRSESLLSPGATTSSSRRGIIDGNVPWGAEATTGQDTTTGVLPDGTASGQGTKPQPPPKEELYEDFVGMDSDDVAENDDEISDPYYKPPGSARSRKPTPRRRRRKGEYPCSECELVFDKPVQLKLHMHTHSRLKPFQCIVCGRAFRQNGHVHVHLKKHLVYPHEVDPNFPKQPQLNEKTLQLEFNCAYCPKIVTHHLDYKRHLASQHSNTKEYQCPVETCAELYGDLVEYIEHVRIHEGNDITYRCFYCEKDFDDLEAIGQHQQKHALMEDLAKVGVDAEDIDDSLSDEGNEHNVSSQDRPRLRNRSDREVQSYAKVQEQDRSRLSNVDPDETVFFDDSSSSEEEGLPRADKLFVGNQRPVEKALVCTLCPHRPYFSKSNALKRHVERHHMEGGKEPMRKTHGVKTKPRPFCTLCDHNPTFVRLSDLRRHVQVYHKKEYERSENERTCDVCNKVFLTAYNLRQHRLWHSSERDHECPEQGCAAKFHRKSDMERHVQRVHKDGNDPEDTMRYKCALCIRVLTGKATLMKHLTEEHKYSNLTA